MYCNRCSYDTIPCGMAGITVILGNLDDSLLQQYNAFTLYFSGECAFVVIAPESVSRLGGVKPSNITSLNPHQRRSSNCCATCHHCSIPHSINSFAMHSYGNQRFYEGEAARSGLWVTCCRDADCHRHRTVMHLGFVNATSFAPFQRHLSCIITECLCIVQSCARMCPPNAAMAFS